MIEPAFNGGHLDGIGVYTQELLRHLPEAGCEVSAVFLAARATPGRIHGGPGAAAILRTRLAVDLLTPTRTGCTCRSTCST
jgi:hypothetical protein